MRPECSHILATGQKCQCLALRGRTLCRHHTPDAPPPAPRRPDLFSRISRWRNLGLTVQTLPIDDIAWNVYAILGSLIADGDDGISDRIAGRLLRALLRRNDGIPALPPAGVYLEPAPQPDPEPAPTLAPQPRSAPPAIPEEFAQMFDPGLIDQLLKSYNPSADPYLRARLASEAAK